MCWSEAVLGVTRRKGQVALGLPLKKQPSQCSPMSLGQRQQSPFPNLTFFRNWAAVSAFRCCRVWRCCRNHRGQWKTKVVAGGEGWKQSQAESYHNYKDVLFCLHVTEESWHFGSENELEITTWKNHMYSRPWFSSHRTPPPENKQALLGQPCKAARTIQQRPIH